jgi:hypothetical protein
MFRIHAIYGATWFVGNHRSKLERGLSQHFTRRQFPMQSLTEFLLRLQEFLRMGIL